MFAPPRLIFSPAPAPPNRLAARAAPEPYLEAAIGSLIAAARRISEKSKAKKEARALESVNANRLPATSTPSAPVVLDSKGLAEDAASPPLRLFISPEPWDGMEAMQEFGADRYSPLSEEASIHSPKPQFSYQGSIFPPTPPRSTNSNSTSGRSNKSAASDPQSEPSSPSSGSSPSAAPNPPLPSSPTETPLPLPSSPTETPLLPRPVRSDSLPDGSLRAALDYATLCLSQHLSLPLVYLVALDLALDLALTPPVLTVHSAFGLPFPAPAFDPALHLKALRAPEGGLLFRRRLGLRGRGGWAAGLLIPVAEVGQVGWVLCGYTDDEGREFGEEDMEAFVSVTERLRPFVARLETAV